MTLKHMFASMAAILSVTAFAWPDWNGGAGDSDWWKASNWGNWGESGMPADGITPETLNDPFWGDGSFNYATGPVEIDLGGKAATVTANLWIRYKGESFTLTNGSMSVGSDIALRKDSGDVETEGPTLVLDEMDMTVGGSINIGADWRGDGTGTIVVEDGSTLWAQNVRMAMTENQQSYYIQNGGITSNYWFGCASRQAQGTGRIELNGGTFNVFEFALDGGGDDPAQINTTLVLNGGLLVPMANGSGWSRDDLVPSWLPIRIGTGGARVKTIGKDINFLSTSITAETGDGGFEKSGPGKLTLKAGVVWSGPTKVLGGTLDLNGGTITGPLVLGGDGKIVNATIQTTDITIMEGYEFDSSEFSTVDTSSKWSLGSLVIRGTGTVLSPRNSLLKSATAWYDPSDATTLTCDENHGVTAVANKSATGSSMNSTLFSDQGFFDRDDVRSTQAEPPYVGTINNLRAIAFTNNVTGFRSNSEVNFAETFGKSVFAVLQRDESMLGDGYVQGSYRSHAEVYPIEWCGGRWIWDSTGVFGTAGQNDIMQYYYYTPPDESSSNGHWEWRSISDGTKVFRDTVPYVTSLRATSAPEGDAPNVFARVTGMVDGDVLDMAGSQAATLGRNESARERIAYGWSMGHYRPSNGLVGEAVAFNRCLNEGEANILQSYLLHKWISPSIEEVGVLHIDDLVIDGTGDFDGSRLEVADLSGSGAVDNALGLKVTGTITARIKADEAAFSADCQVDVTGSALALDESEFVLAEYGQTATVFTATSITGTPTLQLAEGDRRRIKVRNTGVAIVVERVNPGLAVLIR